MTDAPTTEELDEEPVKPPERLRQEELFLWPWRVLLLAATVWAAVYVYWGAFYPIEKLDFLAKETLHGSIQLGLTIFLSLECLYYLYISFSMRRCREWGMIIWALAMFVMGLSAKFPIG